MYNVYVSVKPFMLIAQALTQNIDGVRRRHNGLPNMMTPQTESFLTPLPNPLCVLYVSIYTCINCYLNLRKYPATNKAHQAYTGNRNTSTLSFTTNIQSSSLYRG